MSASFIDGAMIFDKEAQVGEAGQALKLGSEHGRMQRTGLSVATAALVMGTVVLLAVVPACSSSTTPTSAPTSTTRPAATSTSTTSSVVFPEGSAAEVAACQADAKTLEVALEAYMAEKGSFPSPAPWSAASYAANFEPLTAAGGGGPYQPRPPDTKSYVIEFDSSGHVWVAPPGSYGATFNPAQSIDASTDVCLAAVR